jgi:peptide/nickel transport system permease protein
MRAVASRAIAGVVTVLGASIVAFVFLRALPGDPARLVVGSLASQRTVLAERRAMGLDRPLYIQYWDFISGLARGNWGFSYSSGQPVRQLLAARLPASIELGLAAFLFATCGSVALALAITYRRRPFLDRLVRGLAFVGLGTPAFWFGLVALLVLSTWAGILPGPEGRLSPALVPPPHVTGLYTVDALLAGQFATMWNALIHLLLPAVTLGLLPLAYLVRLLRVNLLDVSRHTFMTVARSKGLGRWSVFWRHALPNAGLPMLTACGLIFGELIGGSVVVEKVFDWPGVGSLVANALLQQDYSVVEAFVLLSALAYVVINVVVDGLYSVLDPRVRIPLRERP